MALTQIHLHQHKCKHTHCTHSLSSRAWTVAHRRERCEERCGILLGLIYQRRREVLSGHSSAADSGPGLGPLGDRQTPPRSWGSGKVYHTQTLERTFTPILLFWFNTLVSPFLIKERWAPVKNTPPPGASCSSRQCVYFFCFCCFLSFLASVALLPVCVHAVSPSMTRASHSARWTSHLANLHFLHKSWSCYSFENQMAECVCLGDIHAGSVQDHGFSCEGNKIKGKIKFGYCNGFFKDHTP